LERLQADGFVRVTDFGLNLQSLRKEVS
jgi:hypothetical protein